ncbi:MAG: D-alanine--D-alanine ligase, partial [candidate division WS1 bacterium]|nr:D-alanine--D-alanine ligase [candidate division WS1 bacterium]
MQDSTSDLESLRSRRIGVLSGGIGSEREISLRTGRGILEALRRQGFEAVEVDPQPPGMETLLAARLDVAFIALHGALGEDGVMQALLEFAGIPYTGSGVLASALALHKVQTKRVLRVLGIPTPDWRVVTARDDLEEATERIVAELGLPVVLKPISEGSSVGITIPKRREQLRADLETLVVRYGEGMAESYVPGTELTVGIIGVGERLRPLPVLELVPHREFYDYEAKYVKGLTDLIAPARISSETTGEAQAVGLRAHQALGSHGVSRVDMHLDPQGRLWVTEVNTMPGMT